MSHTAEYSLLLQTRNENILEEHEVHPAEEKAASYKQKWLNYAIRMEDIRHPKQLHDYRPRRRRRPRTTIRLLDLYV